jgi:alpha-mannosidase
MMAMLRKLENLEKAYLEKFDLVMHADYPNYWACRCVLELQYAYRLVRNADPSLLKLVESGVDLAWKAHQEQGALLKGAAMEVEALLAPLAAKAKAYRLLCVGHAHIDMNWMWGYGETTSIALDTFQTMLDLMDEYPGFTFGQSQAAVYRIVEEHAPEMLEKIRQRVAEGRWEVTASTWVEADRNLPNLESTARQFLYTRQYLSQLLGIDPDRLNLDFEPDTFGHHLHVPEVLADAEIKYYYHCRGYEGHVLYRWQAPSGRSILMFREPTWYNWTLDGRSAQVVPEFCETYGLDTMLRVYGVGDHGGGPTRRDLERILDMDTWPIFPRFEFGTYAQFFALADKATKDIPLVKGELNFVFDGCYTTQSRQKKGNRLGEALLSEAEGATALANLFWGHPYNSGGFAAGWKKVLFNQFHDILPGSGTVETREYAMGQYQEALTVANTARTASLRSLERQLDTSKLAPVEGVGAAGRSEGAGVGFGLTEGRVAQTSFHSGPTRLFTVFNPLQNEREDFVQVSVWDWPGVTSRMRWRDAQGNNLAHHVLSSESNAYWGHLHQEVMVKVKLSGLGYNTLVLDEAEPQDFRLEEIGPRLDKPLEIVLENEHLRAEFDLHHGGLISLRDKQTGRELVSRDTPSGVFRLVKEDPIRGMSAWTVGRYLEVTSLNHAVRYKNPPVESGVARQSVAYSLDFGNGSLLSVTVSLYQGEKLLRFDTTVRWQEIGDAKKFFPQLNFLVAPQYAFQKISYDIPMGTLERSPFNHDVPAQSFGMPVNPAGASLLLVCDSKYGFRATGETLALTLIRSSVDPDPWPEIGEHRIQIGLALAEGGPVENLALAQRFCRPAVVTSSKAHPGTLKAHGNLLDLSGVRLVLSGIKKGEQGGLVMRFYEAEGHSGEASLSFAKPPTKAQLANLLEHGISGQAKVEGLRVKFSYKPFSVVTLIVWFA